MCDRSVVRCKSLCLEKFLLKSAFISSHSLIDVERRKFLFYFLENIFPEFPFPKKVFYSRLALHLLFLNGGGGSGSHGTCQTTKLMFRSTLHFAYTRFYTLFIHLLSLLSYSWINFHIISSVCKSRAREELLVNNSIGPSGELLCV